MNNQRGFSLLEALVVASLLVVVSGGVLHIMYQGQKTFRSQNEMNRVSEQARIAMDVIVRYLRQAGNDPFDYMKDGGVPAVQILGSGEMLVNSDVTGSVASATGNPKEATGDPDGALDSIHEQVRFRHDPSTRQLFMDVGYGETVLSNGVLVLAFEYYDNAGQMTSNSSQVAQVKVKMVARTNRPRMGSTHDLMTLHSDVFLRSMSFDPFEADPAETVPVN